MIRGRYVRHALPSCLNRAVWSIEAADSMYTQGLHIVRSMQYWCFIAKKKTRKGFWSSQSNSYPEEGFQVYSLKFKTPGIWDFQVGILEFRTPRIRDLQWTIKIKFCWVNLRITDEIVLLWPCWLVPVLTLWWKVGHQALSQNIWHFSWLSKTM